MEKGNIISSVLVIITSLFFYINTLGFRKIDGQIIGAGFMPKLYAVLLIILSSIIILQNYKKKEEKKAGDNYYKYSLLTMGIVLIYILMIQIIGFYISTILFIFLLLRFAKMENKIILLTIPIGSSLFIYLFFDLLLNVTMPTGFLF